MGVRDGSSWAQVRQCGIKEQFDSFIEQIPTCQQVCKFKYWLYLPWLSLSICIPQSERGSNIIQNDSPSQSIKAGEALGKMSPASLRHHW